jgi:hypothetical protein
MDFNPHILPGKPIKPHEHRKEILVVVISAVILVVIGGLYIWSIKEKIQVTRPTNQIIGEEQLSKLSAILKDASGKATTTPGTLKGMATQIREQSAVSKNIQPPVYSPRSTPQ